MTLDEFKIWTAFHTSKFPNVSAWFKKLGRRGKETSAEWFRNLSNLNLEDCKKASQQMADSPQMAELFPQNHASKIRQLVTGISAARASAFAADCMCHGSGMVEVMNSGIFKTPLGNVLSTETVTVLCLCEKGRWIRQSQENSYQKDQVRNVPPMVVYDREWMVTWEEHNKRDQVPALSSVISSGWEQLPPMDTTRYIAQVFGSDGDA